MSSSGLAGEQIDNGVRECGHTAKQAVAVAKKQGLAVGRGADPIVEDEATTFGFGRSCENAIDRTGFGAEMGSARLRKFLCLLPPIGEKDLKFLLARERDMFAAVVAEADRNDPGGDFGRLFDIYDAQS